MIDVYLPARPLGLGCFIPCFDGALSRTSRPRGATTTETVRRARGRRHGRVRALARRLGIVPKAAAKRGARLDVQPPGKAKSTVPSVGKEGAIVAFGRHALPPSYECLRARLAGHDPTTGPIVSAERRAASGGLGPARGGRRLNSETNVRFRSDRLQDHHHRRPAKTMGRPSRSAAFNRADDIRLLDPERDGGSASRRRHPRSAAGGYGPLARAGILTEGASRAPLCHEPERQDRSVPCPARRSDPPLTRPDGSRAPP